MFTAAPTMIDPKLFRTTMGRFATGVTVISTVIAGRVHGMTANAFLSVSLDPPLVLVSLGHQARMRALLSHGERFGISVLGADQAAWSNHFAGRATEDISISWEWENDVPLLEGAIAHITAEVVDMHPAGDHTLFIGEVETLSHQPGQPLIFHAGAYAQLETPL